MLFEGFVAPEVFYPLDGFHGGLGAVVVAEALLGIARERVDAFEGRSFAREVAGVVN